jgi:hypothetical protein
MSDAASGDCPRHGCESPNPGADRGPRLASASMAGVIRLVPLDERGREILDEFEGKTGEQPTEVQGDGGRLYHVEGASVSGEEFDAMLSRTDSGWPEHITRTSSILP